MLQPLLGLSHTTKLHSLSVDKLEEFRMRIKLHNGSSAYNQALQKHIKAAYELTKRKRGQFAEATVYWEKAVGQAGREPRDYRIGGGASQQSRDRAETWSARAI